MYGRLGHNLLDPRHCRLSQELPRSRVRFVVRKAASLLYRGYLPIGFQDGRLEHYENLIHKYSAILLLREGIDIYIGSFKKTKLMGEIE